MALEKLGNRRFKDLNPAFDDVRESLLQRISSPDKELEEELRKAEKLLDPALKYLGIDFPVIVRGDERSIREIEEILGTDKGDISRIYLLTKGGKEDYKPEEEIIVFNDGYIIHRSGYGKVDIRTGRIYKKYDYVLEKKVNYKIGDETFIETGDERIFIDENGVGFSCPVSSGRVREGEVLPLSYRVEITPIGIIGLTYARPQARITNGFIDTDVCNRNYEENNELFRRAIDLKSLTDVLNVNGKPIDTTLSYSQTRGLYLDFVYFELGGNNLINEIYKRMEKAQGVIERSLEEIHNTIKDLREKVYS